MTQIDFIRHGEPDLHIQNDRLRPLTLKGQQQAEKIAEKLKDQPYTLLYSSPLLRARQTMIPLARNKRLSLLTTPLLVERKMPGWLENFSQYVEEQWSDFSYAKKDGESLKEVQNRYLTFIKTLPEEGIIAVGSHGTAMSTLVEAFYPQQGYKYFQSLNFGDLLRLTTKKGEILQLEKWTF